MAWISSEERKEIEQCFAMTAPLYGGIIDRTGVVSAQLEAKEVMSRWHRYFNQFRNDKCANRTSVISLRRYNAYRSTLNLAHCMQPAINLTTAGIRLTSKMTGVIVMQVSFKK